jgi:hypothetical protein
MRTRCSVINSLDRSMSPPQLLNMLLSSFLDGNIPSPSPTPHWINPDTLAQCHPKQPTTLVWSREEGKTAGWSFLSVQGGRHTSISQQSISHVIRVSIHFAVMQTVFPSNVWLLCFHLVEPWQEVGHLEWIMMLPVPNCNGRKSH